jgi:hypothetical protein
LSIQQGAMRILPQLDLVPDQHEILRYLGYPREARPAPEVASLIERIMPECLEALRPRGTYTVHQVTDSAPDSLKLGNVVVEGAVSDFLGSVDRVAAFVVTVGAEITGRSEHACRDGDAFTGWVFDAVGSWAVEAAADALMVHLQATLDEGDGLTLRYSPGYCGMDLSQQHAIFSLTEAASVGVTLLPSMMMSPAKSISGLVGIGPVGELDLEASPCDRCPQVGCHMRR